MNRDRPRALSRALGTLLREFPVVAVTGLRQVGKTTLVMHPMGRSRHFVTLDDVSALASARSDPEGFLSSLPRPLTIDEVQRAPELLLPIKREVDRGRRSGAFLLTGSARLSLRRTVQETLAGRVAVLRLRPLTWAEAGSCPTWNPVDLLLSCRTAAQALARFGRGPALDSSRLLAGGLPVPMLRRKGGARTRWFEHYRKAYIEQDVPALLKIEELSSFVRFLTLAASRSAQTTNYSSIAQAAGISTDTGLRWFSVLEASFLVDLVPPFFRNIGKRLVRSPKVYFADTGLLAHLLGAHDAQSVARDNLLGPILETLVAQHVLAFSEVSRRPTSVFHYRTHAGAEVDFVLSRGRTLLPIEVKSARTMRSGDARGLLSFLDDFSEAPFGVILSAATEPVPVARRVVTIPITTFMGGPA